jgi:uncharacterized membrane protein
MRNEENGILIGSIHVPDELFVRTSWLLPAIIVPLSMVIHLLSGNSRDFPFFISEADYPGVERWVFTVGLAISGLLQMLFAYRVWYKYKLEKSTKLLFFFLLCGLFVGANLFIMSFANMYDHLKLHVLTASIVFQLGIVWAILAHFALPGKNKPGKKIRIYAILISVISYIVMSQAIVRAVAGLDDYGLEDDTMFTLDRIQYAVDIAAYAEYALFVALILCLYSIEKDLLAEPMNSQE